MRIFVGVLIIYSDRSS